MYGPEGTQKNQSRSCPQVRQGVTKARADGIRTLTLEQAAFLRGSPICGQSSRTR